MVTVNSRLAGLALGLAVTAFASGDLSRFGFDAVIVAYFTAVIVGQWKGRSDLFPFITAAAVAVADSSLRQPHQCNDEIG